MTLEAGIERRAVAYARALKYEVIKIGTDGWPDDLVLLGRGRHFWWEFKNEVGRLRKAQEIRTEIMRDAAEVIYVPRSYAEAVEQLHYEIRLHNRGSTVAGNWRR